jgi:hypothetical protein
LLFRERLTLSSNRSWHLDADAAFALDPTLHLVARETHSVGQAKVKTLIFGGRGGRCYEVWHDGTERSGDEHHLGPAAPGALHLVSDRTADSAQDIECA